MILNLSMSHNASGDPSQLSPLTLAFVGDTVFDLFVKEQLAREANRPVGRLQSLAASRVCAGAQAKAAFIVADMLTEEEAAVFRRGRNARTTHTPKNSTEAEYHMATALEALFGWLWLKGRGDRLEELYNVICG